MPDISGFSKFVNETAIEHSNHIIHELLEIIINANELNMEVMEIEGDAVFFYRFGNMPTAKEIVAQSKNIFLKFQGHLLQYASRRICQCGACRTAIDLTLKFVVHAGEVSSYRINHHFKLMGKEVILLHRLLKNKINLNKYLLFTENLFHVFNAKHLEDLSLQVKNENEVFDEIVVNYKYVPIEQWLQEVKYPLSIISEKELSLTTVISLRKQIEAPAATVFSYITNLSKRAEWMEGIEHIEIVSDDKINQLSTVHECILFDNTVSFFTSNHLKNDDSSFSITEEDNKKNIAHRFTVKSLPGPQCIVEVQFLIKDVLASKLMFIVFMKNKMIQRLKKSLQNIAMKFEQNKLSN